MQELQLWVTGARRLVNYDSKIKNFSLFQFENMEVP